MMDPLTVRLLVKRGAEGERVINAGGRRKINTYDLNLFILRVKEELQAAKEEGRRAKEGWFEQYEKWFETAVAVRRTDYEVWIGRAEDWGSEDLWKKNPIYV